MYSLSAAQNKKEETVWFNATTSRFTVEIGKYHYGFVYKLPRTQNGYDGVWVVVDRFTKSAHFILVREKYSLNKWAELFITKMVKYHGIPVSIVSDRDPRFTSKLWTAFQEALGTRLLYCTAYRNDTVMKLYMEKSCRTPLCWSEVGERVLVGPEIVEETTQNVQVIKSNLKAAQDRQKSLADVHATDRVYKVND